MSVFSVAAFSVAASVGWFAKKINATIRSSDAIVLRLIMVAPSELNLLIATRTVTEKFENKNKTF
jgi:hypothetical protein